MVVLLGMELVLYKRDSEDPKGPRGPALPLVPSLDCPVKGLAILSPTKERIFNLVHAVLRPSLIFSSKALREKESGTCHYRCRNGTPPPPPGSPPGAPSTGQFSSSSAQVLHPRAESELELCKSKAHRSDFPKRREQYFPSNEFSKQKSEAVGSFK